MQQSDWNVIVERKPLGYVELNDGKVAVYGPIQNVTVDDNDIVHIKTKWAIKRGLGEFGMPITKWEVVSNEPTNFINFPNFMVPFEIEDTPEKGPRARFGFSIIYFNDVQKVDPSEVDGLRVVTA